MSPSTPPFSCAPRLPGWQQERVEPIVAAQRDKPLVPAPGRGPARSGQPLSRRLSSPMPPRHPTQHLERQHMPLEERPWAAWLANATCNRLARGARTAGQTATPWSRSHPATPTAHRSRPLSSSPTRWTCGTVTHPTPPVSSRRSPGDVAADGRPSPARRRSRRPAAASIGRAVCRCLLGEHLVGGHPRADQRLPSAQAPAPPALTASARAAPRSSRPGGPSAGECRACPPTPGRPSLPDGHPGGYSRTAPALDIPSPLLRWRGNREA
jgi:hypothetical protein